MPTVSVVIPAYNSERFVNDAIESVLGQRFEDFEIIVIDDGSVDNTRDTISRYPKTKYFYQPNQGPSAARNRGIVESQGKYIAFLDADDTLLPDSLQLRHDYLERHTDVDFVFSDLLRCYDIGGKPEVHLKENGFLPKFMDAVMGQEGNEYVFGESFTEMALRYHPFIKTPTVMARKATLDRHNGFNSRLFIAEDVDLWLRIADSGRLGFIDAPLAVWNNYRSGMTANNTRMLEETIRYYRSLASRFESAHNATRLRLLRQKLSSLYFRLGYALYCEGGRRGESIVSYLHSLRHSPSNMTVVLFILAAITPRPLLKYTKKLLTCDRK